MESSTRLESFCIYSRNTQRSACMPCRDEGMLSRRSGTHGQSVHGHFCAASGCEIRQENDTRFGNEILECEKNSTEYITLGPTHKILAL